MVVVLIIAILIAIAIPTFLGAQDRARDSGAQSDLRNALTAAKTVATDHEGYFKIDDGTGTLVALDDVTMAATEPSLEFVPNWEDATQEKVGVTVIGTGVDLGQQIFFARVSGSKTTFGITTDQQGKTKFCKSPAVDGVAVPFAAATAAASCNDPKW